MRISIYEIILIIGIGLIIIKGEKIKKYIKKWGGWKDG